MYFLPKQETSDSTLTPFQADGTESAESASMVSVADHLEPMDALESASSASSQAAKNIDVEDVEDVDQSKNESLLNSNEKDQEEGDIVMKETSGERAMKEEDDDVVEDYQLSLEDLTLLSHLFYLPFEHGPQGMELLQEFNWLKLNSHLVGGSAVDATTASSKSSSPEVKEWHQRAEKFDGMSKALNRLFTRLTYINNRELLYELYPYAWDMRGVVALLNSYVKWLGMSLKIADSVVFINLWKLCLSACHQGSKQGFLSGEQEPWVFRGGLAADLQVCSNI